MRGRIPISNCKLFDVKRKQGKEKYSCCLLVCKDFSILEVLKKK